MRSRTRVTRDLGRGEEAREDVARSVRTICGTVAAAVHLDGGETRLGEWIEAKSLCLGDCSAAETRTLLLEHTRETGQVFTPEALDHVWELTQGQPWLVNALAYRACFEVAVHTPG